MENNNTGNFKDKYLTALLSVFSENKELVQNYQNYNFNQLGINSLGFIKLLLDLEKKYQIKFSGEELVPDYYYNMSSFIEIIQKKIKEKETI